MKILGVIPSRLKSSRIVEKPLVDICGMPLIAHVYKRASFNDRLDDLIVATDSELVRNEVEKFGGTAVMTDPGHANGTERMHEVLESRNEDIAVLINGDEALLNPDHISTSVDTLVGADVDASILATRFYKKNSPGDFKIVLNAHGDVLYISRNDIPSEARNSVEFLLKAYHIMAFRRQTVRDYCRIGKTHLESIEDHEHLRLVEHGYRIRASIVDSDSISVDTPEDLEYVRNAMQADSLFPRYRR